MFKTDLNVESIEEIMKKPTFAHHSPCIYRGAIRCRQCDRWKYCDMRQGRVLHEQHWEAGFKAGISVAMGNSCPNWDADEQERAD